MLVEWSRSARPSGSGSQSASSTTTAMCPSTRSWSTSSPTTGSRVDRTAQVGWWSGTTASPSTGGRCIAMSSRRPSGRGSATSTLTSSATPWPTQAINRGMSLEAIAALLGHRSMRMTMTYARISDRTVADEYFRLTEAVEANYGRTEALPDTAAGANMRRLEADHRRMLGNWMCTDRSPSTARSSQPVSAATSSRPDPSSFRSSAGNGTTPPNTVRKTGSSSSTASSRTSTGSPECGSMSLSPGPVDHPCDNTSGASADGPLPHDVRPPVETGGQSQEAG